MMKTCRPSDFHTSVRETAAVPAVRIGFVFPDGGHLSERFIVLPTPKTLGDYLELCRKIGGEDCRAVEWLEELIKICEGGANRPAGGMWWDIGPKLSQPRKRPIPAEPQSAQPPLRFYISWYGNDPPPIPGASQEEYVKLDVRTYRSFKEYKRAQGDDFLAKGANHRIIMFNTVHGSKQCIARDMDTTTGWFVRFNSIDEMVRLMDGHENITLTRFPYSVTDEFELELDSELC